MATQPEKTRSLQADAADYVRSAAEVLEVLLSEAHTRRDRINEKWIAQLLTDARLLQQSLELLAGEEVRC